MKRGTSISFLSLLMMLLTTTTAGATDISTITVNGVEYSLFSGFTVTAGHGGGTYSYLVDGDNNTFWNSDVLALTGEAYEVQFRPDDDIAAVIPKGYILNNDAGQNAGLSLASRLGDTGGWYYLSIWATAYIDVKTYNIACDNSDNRAFNRFFFKFNGAYPRIRELRIYGWYYTHLTAKAATCAETGILRDCYYRSDGKYFTDLTGETELSASDVVEIIPHSGVHHVTPDGNVEYWQCSVCGKYFSDAACTEEIAHPHTGVHHVTSDGNVEYWQCSVCGKYFSDAACTEEITHPHTGVHHVTPDTNVEYWQCSVCDKYFSDAACTDEIFFVTSGMTSWPQGRYFVTEDVTIPDRINVSGQVSLTLCDNTTLTVSEGINVGSGSTLQIDGFSTDEQTMGTLIARTQEDNNRDAAIGGYYSSSKKTGNIIISGGKVQAHSLEGAGIGGGSCGQPGEIYLKGGVIIASSESGSGIGSGAYSEGNATVNIYDGISRIDASSTLGMAIGNGYSTEGTVTANFYHGDTQVTGTDKDAVFYDTGEGTSRVIRTKAWNHNIHIGNEIQAHITPNTPLAIKGETVTLTLGTLVDETTLTVSDGTNSLALTDMGNRQYSFVMPDGDVSVTVSLFTADLRDGVAYDHTNDFVVATATYTKTLGEERVGRHQAWMMPFDYTLTTADLEKFTFYKINMIANSPSPSVEASDEMWVFLTRLNAGAVLHANMPYVYKPLEAVTDYAFTTAPATLKAKNTGVIAKTETLEDIYSFYATYENTTATAADPFYYVGIDGNVSYGDDVTVGPYRWIIRKTSKFGGTPTYARRMYFYDGGEDATSIGNGPWTVDNEDSSLSGWYGIDGRKLDKQPTHHGVYVHQGKKVIIR